MFSISLLTGLAAFALRKCTAVYLPLQEKEKNSWMKQKYKNSACSESFWHKLLLWGPVTFISHLDLLVSSYSSSSVRHVKSSQRRSGQKQMEDDLKCLISVTELEGFLGIRQKIRTQHEDMMHNKPGIKHYLWNCKICDTVPAPSFQFTKPAAPVVVTHALCHWTNNPPLRQQQQTRDILKHAGLTWSSADKLNSFLLIRHDTRNKLN